MNIIRKTETQLTSEQERQILTLQRKAFPQTQEFKTQRWYQTPLADDDLWYMAFVDDNIAGCVRVIHRIISAGDQEYSVAGIANVCSDPQGRGKGLAKGCMIEAARNFTMEPYAVDFGILFGGPPVQPFYRKLGWQSVTAGKILHLDDNGQIQEYDLSSASMMLHPGRTALNNWPQSEINLNGPLW